MQIHRLVRVGDEVVGDADVEGAHAEVAVRPRERAAREGVIRPRQRRAVGRGVARAHRAKRAIGAHDGDRRHRARLGNAVGRLAEADLAGAELIIQNRQHRIGLARHRHRRAERRVRRIQQREQDRLRAVGERVVEDENRERLRRGVAVEPGQSAGGREIIAGTDGGAIRRGVLHAVGVGRATEAQHGDRHRAAVLDHGVAGHAEVRVRVVVENRQRRARGTAQHAHARAQIQQHRAVHVRARGVDDGDREVRAHLAIGEREHVAHAHVIRARHRRIGAAGNRHVGHRQLAHQAAGTINRDHRDRTIFGNRVRRRGVSQRARTGVVAAIYAHQIRLRNRIKRGERTAENNPAILELHQRRLDVLIRARAEVDARIQRAAGRQAGRATARDAVHIRESAADHEATVALHRDRVHVIIRPRRERAEVHRAGEAHPREVRAAGRSELAADNEIRRATEHLNRHIRHRSRRAGRNPIRGERRVHRAVGQQPRQAGHGRRADLRERAAHDDAAVTGQGHRGDVSVGRRVETGVRRAIRIESREEVADRAVHQGERAADHDLAIGLHEHGLDGVVRAGRIRERGIERTERGQTRDAIDRLAIDGGEEAAHDHHAIGLDVHRFHHAVDDRIEGRVARAIHVQPRQARLRCTVDLRERAADEELAGEARGGDRRAVELRVGIRERERAAPERAGDQNVVRHIEVQREDLRVRHIRAELIPRAERRSRREVNAVQGAHHHAADAEELMRDDLRAEERIAGQVARDVHPRTTRVGGLVHRAGGHHIHGHPVERIDDEVRHRAAGERRRRGRQRAHRVCPHVNQIAGTHVEQVGIRHATERAAVGNARAVGDAGAYFREVVRLIERFVNRVCRRDDEASAGHRVGLNRRVELCDHRRTTTRDRQGREVDGDLGARRVERAAIKALQVLRARVEHRETGVDQRVDRDVATVARRKAAPDQRVHRGLPRRVVVLRSRGDDVADGVVHERVNFRELRVAIDREPITVGRRGRRAFEEAAIAAVQQIARGIKRQRAPVGVRRAAAGRVRVRDVRPLAARRLRGVAAEQTPGVVHRADRVRERAGVLEAQRLPVTRDVNEVRIRPVRAEREVDGTLTARMNAHRAGTAGAGFRRRRQIHRRPRRTTVGGIEHRRQHAVGDNAHEDRRGRPGREFHVVSRTGDLRLDRDIADTAPRRAKVRRLEDAADAATKHRRVVNRRVQGGRAGRVHHEIRRHPDGKARDRAIADGQLHPVGAIIDTAENTDVVGNEEVRRIHCDDDLQTALGHRNDVLPGHRAADFAPRRPAIRRELQAAARAALTGEAAQIRRAGDDRVEGCVQRVVGQRADRKGLQPIRQRRPTRTRRRGIGGFPNATVHRAKIRDVHIARLRQQAADRAANLFIGDARDTAVAFRRGALGGPHVVREYRRDATRARRGDRHVLLHGEDRAIQERRKRHVVRARRHGQVVVIDREHCRIDRTQARCGRAAGTAQREVHRLR